MMNIKDTINFKKIREKGPKAIDIKGDEIVQIVSGGKEIFYVVTQEYLLSLIGAQNALFIQNNLIKEEIREVNIDEKMKQMKPTLQKIADLSNEDKKEFSK